MVIIVLKHQFTLHSMVDLNLDTYPSTLVLDLQIALPYMQRPFAQRDSC